MPKLTARLAAGVVAGFAAATTVVITLKSDEKGVAHFRIRR